MAFLLSHHIDHLVGYLFVDFVSERPSSSTFRVQRSSSTHKAVLESSFGAIVLDIVRNGDLEPKPSRPDLLISL